ncbi:MAG: hypothetical protein NE327_17630 [Lentisphaeraceae bacterium]|nr:hypothetical protein [Lentisphaeraceae bacterium]
MPIDITKEEVYACITRGVEEALKEYRREYLPSRILVDMIDTWPETDVEIFISAYPESPSMLLERLAYTSKNPEVLCNVASHPRTGAKVMQDLASHKEEGVRLMLAANKQISPQTATLLGEDDSLLVRAELAANPALPTRVRTHLIGDPAALVRSVFCDAKNLDDETVKKLLMDPDHLVKARTAIMAKVSDETLLSWADRDELFVQLFLHARKNLPPKVMESLSFSSHKDIQQLAISRKALAEDEQLGWANSSDTELKIAIAKKEELTEKVQLILAKDEDIKVRESLAGNNSLSAEVQKILASDTQGNIAKILLEKEDLKREALTELCKTCDEKRAFELALEAELSNVQVAVLATRFSADIVYVLARRGLFTNLLSREKVVELVNSRMPTLMAFAIKSKCLNAAEISKFLTHPCKEVRLALLQNENVSRSMLIELSEDEDRQISEEALELLAKMPAPKKEVSEEKPEEESKNIITKIIKKIKPNKGDE